ncbi:MAG TPA: aldose 1-epimerase [Pirellulaceae bacterium]|nr:aldose 1-epimerase [Pirellulaceae bacterium]
MTPEIVTLRDAITGSSAEILVSQGFNCFRFTAIAGGQPVEVIYAPPDFSRGQSRPSSGGIPILFPFPGRIPGTILRWEGKEYQLEAGDAFGNAIHGFVHARPWRVVEQSESRVVGEFHAWRDDPSLQARWPADFRITATYALAASELRMEYLLENPGEAPLPCGLGVHPYFRLPLGGSSRDACIVKLPVSSRWELKDMLPTGRRLELEDAAAYQEGRTFGELKLDDVFSGLVPDSSGELAASITDPGGCRLTIRFGQPFRECVAYTPPHREAICIEPYTCVPGAFELEARGIDAGLQILPPGAALSAAMNLNVS